MSPSNPSRKRVLPSWIKKVKSSKSPNAAGPSSTSVFPDSSKRKESASTSRENATDAEEADRISHKSMFVPRNTVLFVMSELELLETARLILEEDDHSPSPVQQPENTEAVQNDYDNNAEKEEEHQQNEEQQHVAKPPDMHLILNSVKNRFGNTDESNDEMSNDCDSSNHQLKRVSKRRLDGSPKRTDGSMDDEDAMDVERSPVISADANNEQFTSALRSAQHSNKKHSLFHLTNHKMDTKTSSPNITPTPKKRLKPNLAILDEIFF